MPSKFYLPSKINSYLRRLLGEYKATRKSKLVEIISSAKVFIVEGNSYDNLDGGIYGHDIKLFLSESILSTIRIADQRKYTSEIMDDLGICSGHVQGEFINKVVLELNDENDQEYQLATSLIDRPLPNPDTLSMWKQGQIRLFVSHRDIHKSSARHLADLLSEYGVSAFVAHDSIEPMTTWQNEILKGLESMEIMLAFITDDFHESYWTNQEIGYALARNIPVISLKLGTKDPCGFIAQTQALKGKLDNLLASVPEIYSILSERLGNKDRLQSALINSFIQSTDFNVSIDRFNRISKVVKKLAEEDLVKIKQAYKENDQLHRCGYLNGTTYNRMKKFLENSTGKKFEIQGASIIEVNENDLEIPF
jgi:hypothetical protein